jgi:hypothetical protein
MGEKPRNSSESDQVVTPGGPRPKDRVRAIKPGEALRRNPDGTYSIVPIKKPPQKRKEQP